MPTFQVNPLNLPLRLRLAGLVVKLIQGDIGADQWTLVTSLVERARLEEIFNTELPRLFSATGTGEVNFTSNRNLAQVGGNRSNWQLDDPRLEETSIREVFCTMQGLRRP